MSIKVSSTIQTTIPEHDLTLCRVHYEDYHQYERYRHTIIREVFKLKRYRNIQRIAHMIDKEVITHTEREQ